MGRRVLLIMAELTFSGAETMLRAIGPHLREREIDAHVMSTGHQGEGAFSGALRDAGYVVHHVPFRRHPGFLGDVWRLIRREGFDVVHIHCERANFWLGFLAVLAGARTVRTVHAVFPFHGGLRWRRLAQRRISRRLGVVFTAPSMAVIDNEAHRFANPCRRLNNWIDTARFPPVTAAMRTAARARLAVADQDFAVVSVGGCAPIKNHDAILRALALLPPAVIYLHVGQGPRSAAEQDLAAALGVAERVRWLGAIDAVADVLAAADLFLMPSEHEALGLAAVEALASGLPCLLNPVGGLKELGPYLGGGGWCGTSPQALADGIGAMMARDRCETLGLCATAARRVRQDHGPAAGLTALLALWGLS